MKYLLKNGTVVTGEKSEQLDILVEGEKIVQVGKIFHPRMHRKSMSVGNSFFQVS